MVPVSQEYLRKVEMFFIMRAKELETNRIVATVQEVAAGSEVALATAHKAIKELKNRGIIEKIKPSSRRFPITYIYNGEVNIELNKDSQGMIEHLLKELEAYKQLALALNMEIEELRNRETI